MFSEGTVENHQKILGYPGLEAGIQQNKFFSVKNKNSVNMGTGKKVLTRATDTGRLKILEWAKAEVKKIKTETEIMKEGTKEERKDK
jgi:hypothetical protein